MPKQFAQYDAIVIGGGFYGCSIASYLARFRGFRRILLLERHTSLLTRASYRNQARIHNGYHYPRSFTTAFRSRVNFPQFIEKFPDSVFSGFTKLYAIARRNSKVTPRQFERFCDAIGASLSPPAPELTRLFNPQLISSIYIAKEYTFNALRLAEWAFNELATNRVELRTNTIARAISKEHNNHLTVHTSCTDMNESFTGRYVFNCTYCSLNGFTGDFIPTSNSLKHEITEMALVTVPNVLQGLGITVMDGPFFSLMPFPAEGLHTLSHVRYTPHHSWIDSPLIDPNQALQTYSRQSRYVRMVRDVVRYLPTLEGVKHKDSLFEIKTVLVRNESDDGRPILFERNAGLPNVFSILGGKIDNVFDIIAKLELEQLP